jgi:hypothetical protein
LKYPNHQTEIECIISDFQRQLNITNPDDDFTSNLFHRMMSRFFPRSIDRLQKQFNLVEVSNTVFHSITEISEAIQIIQVGTRREFEEILDTYFTLRYTIANYLRFFDEYGPYQEILKQGFKEIFANRNLQESFENRSNRILEKLYLKK